jgi:peroxiredoxin Q/BCP
MKKLVLLAGVFSLGVLSSAATVQTPVELKEGDAAPAFSLPGTDGKTHTLAQYKGRAVILAWFPAAFTGG